MNTIKVLLVCGPGDSGEIIKLALLDHSDIEVATVVPCLAVVPAGRHDVVLVEAGPDTEAIASFVAMASVDSGVVIFSDERRKSLVAESIVRGLEAGAFDYAVLPACRTREQTIEVWGRRLATKVRTASTRVFSRAARALAAGHTEANSAEKSIEQRVAEAAKSLAVSPGRFDLVVIGASTGGPEALLKMLPLLPEGLQVPILLVIHMPRDFTGPMAANLSRKCRFEVTEAQDREILKPGRAYLAPGDMHLLVARGIGTNLLVRLDNGPLVNECRPSVDVLFSSAARACPGRAIGVILTGMGCDGSAGAGKLRESGCVVVAQDKATSLIWGMPGSANTAGNVDILAPLLEIPVRLLELIAGPASAQGRTANGQRGPVSGQGGSVTGTAGFGSGQRGPGSGHREDRERPAGGRGGIVK